MIIEKYKIKDIRPSSYNPRIATDAEYLGLKNSIKRFNLLEPLIVNKKTGNLVGGHLRYRVLKELKYKEVPVVEVNLSDKEEKALNIVLNSHTVQGKFELESLSSLLEEIKLDMPDDFFGLRFDQLEKDLGINFELPGDSDEASGSDSEEAQSKTFHECPSCGFKFAPKR